MRFHLVLLAGCLAPWSALCEPASISRVEITAYGIVAGPAGFPDGVMSGGIVHRTSHGNKVVETTTRVPACLGTKFGIVFSALGAAGGTPLDVTEVYRFPRSGLRKPGALAPIHEALWDRWLVPGTVGHGIWYSFDNPWELVPGEWTFELRDGIRLLASKTFTVVAPKQTECRSLSA
jgi:hypothetical protein